MSRPRRQAREAALQILYAWEVGRTQPQTAIDTYFEQHRPEAAGALREFAAALVHGTVAHLADLDRLIDRHAANWRIERLAVIDRLILRMAAWELTVQRDAPAAVVLDEAIELARRFSTEDAAKFVNGVLDAMRLAEAPDAGPEAGPEAGQRAKGKGQR